MRDARHAAFIPHFGGSSRLDVAGLGPERGSGVTCPALSFGWNRTPGCRATEKAHSVVAGVSCDMLRELADALDSAPRSAPVLVEHMWARSPIGSKPRR